MITFLSDAPSAGAHNMATDERLAHEALTGRDTVIVRLYGWEPDCISLGHHQSIDLLDLRAVRDRGVDVVSRPTGGGAIFHAEELTYSVTLTPGSMRPLEVYDMIAQGIEAGLRLLNIAADDERPAHGRYIPTALCFTGFARSEIRCGGRKLVGSAQRVYRAENGATAILQHGSILLGPRHAEIPHFLSGLTDAERVLAAQGLRERSTDISSLLGRTVGMEEAGEAIRRGCKEVFESILDMKRTEVTT